jgi:hypothetical protein
MGRPADILRPVPLHTSIPEDLHGKLSLYLYSPAEGRVPKGAYAKFIRDRIVEFFNSHEVSNDHIP